MRGDHGRHARGTKPLARRSFLSRAGALAVTAACAHVAPTPAPPSSPHATPGLAGPITAELQASSDWALAERGRPARFAATFSEDPSAGRPRLRLAGREAPFVREAGAWTAALDLVGAPSGLETAELVVTLSDGRDVAVASRKVIVAAPVYVVWTIDFEGYDEPDPFLANVVATAPGPLTLLFHPREILSGALPVARRDAIVRWILERARFGDEVGMHLHMQHDFVRSAAVTPRTTPRWGLATDGYDVPMTAYTEAEQAALVERGVALMTAAGLPRPTSFRAGGLFADARTLRALESARFTADTSARDAGSTGSLRVPWTLPFEAQPYRPNRDDANRADPPTFDLLEVPNTAGNTYSDSAVELQRRRRRIWPGDSADHPRVLDLVSHPSTFGAEERARTVDAFAPLVEASAERGPVRFVTLRELLERWG